MTRGRPQQNVTEVAQHGATEALQWMWQRRGARGASPLAARARAGSRADRGYQGCRDCRDCRGCGRVRIHKVPRSPGLHRAADRLCVCVCVCARARACVRACVRARVRACGRGYACAELDSKCLSTQPASSPEHPHTTRALPTSVASAHTPTPPAPRTAAERGAEDVVSAPPPCA